MAMHLDLRSDNNSSDNGINKCRSKASKRKKGKSKVCDNDMELLMASMNSIYCKSCSRFAVSTEAFGSFDAAHLYSSRQIGGIIKLATYLAKLF